MSVLWHPLVYALLPPFLLLSLTFTLNDDDNVDGDFKYQSISKENIPVLFNYKNKSAVIVKVQGNTFVIVCIGPSQPIYNQKHLNSDHPVFFGGGASGF